MSTNAKIDAAMAGCQKIQTQLTAARTALDSGGQCNEYGIFHDPSELRCKLLSAQTSIQNAMNKLNEIEWPTNPEYDQLWLFKQRNKSDENAHNQC